MQNQLIENLSGFLNNHPLLNGFTHNHPMLVLLIGCLLGAIGLMRLWFKPATDIARRIVAKTPWKWDDWAYRKAAASPIWKGIFWLVNYLCSVGLLKVLLLCGFCAFLLTGCLHGNSAVPSTRIRWNPNSGACDITAPKNSTLEDFEISRSGSNITIRVKKAQFANDPETVAQSYAGQAAMIEKGFGLGVQTLEKAATILRGTPQAPVITLQPGPDFVPLSKTNAP